MGVCNFLCFVVRYFMSILVLQSSSWGREGWLLCSICLPGVSGWLPRCAMRLSAVCDCGFPDHTHYYFVSALIIIDLS